MLPLLLALLPSPARGHAGASLAGVDLHAGADGITLFEGNFGLLLQGHDPADPTRWDWICHEAITTADARITPRYDRDPDGVIWAVVPDPDQAGLVGRSVYTSVDGCDWQPVEGLAEQAVVALAVDPARSGHVVAITADRVLRTTDGGATWSEWASPDATLDDVAIGLGGVVWVTGHGDDLVVLHGPGDGSPTESHHPAPDAEGGAGEVTLTIATLSPDDAAVAWLVAGPTTGDHLWRTDDGGASVAELMQVTNDIVDGAVSHDGAVWLVEGSRALWRSTDGRAFTPVSGVPLGIGVDADPAGNGVRLTSFAEYTGILLADVDPGGAWTPALRPPDLTGPLACRDGSTQRERCVPLWADVQASIDLYQPADSGDSGAGGGGAGSGHEEEEGCCGGGGAGAAGLWLAGPLGLWIRRRKAR
ncbi:MAG: hypothetical protein H6742_21230 [Alphaproteobacteria bacterium]|nr:hypothetical protein [Alphaproteobacteria bacterium]